MGSSAWHALQLEAAGLPSLRELFAADPDRGTRLNAGAAGLLVDYSKNRITDAGWEGLFALAKTRDLRRRIDAMFAGEKINHTEDRAALHVALRAPRDAVFRVGGTDVVPAVHGVLDTMSSFCDQRMHSSQA